MVPSGFRPAISRVAARLSGDLLAARTRHRHGLVLVTVLTVVVDRQFRPATRLPARPALGERLRRPFAAAEGVPSQRSFAHHFPLTLAGATGFLTSYTSLGGDSD